MSKINASPKKVAKNFILNTEKLAKGFKSLREQKTKKATVIAAFLAVAIAAVVFFLSAPLSVTGAMLYLIADNGKKSGRADGNVYMRNGRVRGFKVPSLVRNAYTGTARGSFGAFSQAWNSLTEDQRLGWNNASGEFTSDRFGRQVEVKGKQLFVAWNMNSAYAGGGVVNSYIPDALVGELLELSCAADESASSLAISFAVSPVDVDNALVIFATAQQKVGIYRPSQSKYRFITAVAAGVASGVDIGTAYEAKFGNITAGKKIFVRAFKVSVLSGKAGAPLDANTIVVA